MKGNIKGKFLEKKAILSNGMFANNPVFRLVLGTCPTLAVTTGAVNGLGMGLATTVVLVGSNILISMLRNIIPDKVRIPAYVLIIATLVSVLQMLLMKFVPTLYHTLGIYLPLIVVNCIIFARAEAFASTNKVFDSALDGFGMGLGFTGSLVIMGLVREFFGAGSLFYGELAGFQMGVKFAALGDLSMSVLLLPAGGFLVFGLLMAAVNAISDATGKRRERKTAQIAEHQLSAMLNGENAPALSDMQIEEAADKNASVSGATANSAEGIA